jgi:hypothetical protein
MPRAGNRHCNARAADTEARVSPEPSLRAARESVTVADAGPARHPDIRQAVSDDRSAGTVRLAVTARVFGPARGFIAVRR